MQLEKKMEDDYVISNERYSPSRKQFSNDLFIQENENEGDRSLGLHEEKAQFRTGEGSMIEPKTSFFTSS